MNIKKSIISALFLSFFVLPTKAQVGEIKNNFALGINGGINFSNAIFSPTINQKNMIGMNGGVTARYISEKYFKMICGAQFELNYAQRGWNEYYEDYPDLKYTRSMNYIEIPFLAHLAFGKENKGMQFFIHAGPQINFLINDSEKISGDWEDYSTFITTEQHGKNIDNKFDYGITGGLGIELKTKAGNFIVEGRYYYALSDFYNSTKKDFFSRSANNTISIKVSYLIDITK